MVLRQIKTGIVALLLWLGHIGIFSESPNGIKTGIVALLLRLGHIGIFLESPNGIRTD